MKKILGKLFFCLILFLFLFAIPLPIVKNSAYICIILLPFVLFNSQRYNNIKALVSSRYCLTWLLLYLLIIFYTFIIIAFKATDEVDIYKTLFNNVFTSIIALVIVSFFYEEKSHYSAQVSEKYFLSSLLFVFIIQSVIEIFAFVSPSFKDIINVMNNDDAYVENILTTMGTRKGFALSGSLFFSLSAQFALIYVFFIRKVIISKMSTLRIVFSSIVLFIGGILAGRTFLLGFLFAGLYYIYAEKNIKKTVKSIFFLVVSVTFLYYIIELFSPDIIEKIENMAQYSFEMFYNFFDDKGLTTTSTDSLHSMYFPVPLKTFFTGDGYWANPFGFGYYMNTDAGYMRNILLFGIFGFMLLLFAQTFMLYSKKNSVDTKFANIILLLILVLHYKGEVLSFLLSIQKVLYLYCAWMLITAKAKHRK